MNCKLTLLLIALMTVVKGLSQTTGQLHNELASKFEKQDYAACVKLEREVDAATKNQRDTISARSCFYLGQSYYELGQYDKAIVWLEREKAMRTDLGLVASADYNDVLYNLAYINLQAGRYTDAGTAADALIENSRKFKKADQSYADDVLSAADIYMQVDKFEAAEKLLQSAIRQFPKNSAEQGMLLTKLGDLYTLTNQYSKASRTLHQAVAVLEKSAGIQSPEYVSASINQAILYTSRGQYPEAEEVLDFALQTLPQEDGRYIPTLNNQALVYQHLGQLDRAEQIFRQIKEADSTAIGTDHPDFAVTLSNLGMVYADEGKYAEAERVLLRALEIQRKSNEAKTISYARKLNNLAKIYRMSGAAEKSIPLLEEAMGIFKRRFGAKSPEYATTAFNLGISYWKTGKSAVALKHLKTSASIRASKLGKKHPKYAESVQKIAEFQWEQKQLRDAARSFGEVFDNYYYQIDATFPVLTEEEKAKFYYTNIRPSIDKFNSFAMVYRNENPPVIGDVYNYQINTKGSIMAATEKVRAAILQSNDSVMIAQYEQWQSLRERIAKMFSQNAAGAELDSLAAKTDRLEKQLARKSEVFSRQFVRERNTWQEIQKALKPGEAAVETVRFKQYAPDKGGRFRDTVVYAFLVVTTATRDNPDVVMIENGNEIEGKFLRYYRNYIQYMLDDQQSYRNYFKPLGEYLKKQNVRKVYLSPDGVYNQLNINTFKDPEQQKFLIDEFEVQMITNTRQLVTTKEPKNNSQSSSILIGYPKFNVESEAVVAQQGGATRALTRSGNLTRTLRGGLLRYMRGDEGIVPLPGTQREIEQIAELSPSPQVYTEEKASEEAVKRVESPAVLHIATHGYFLEDDKSVGTRATEATTSYIPNPLLKSGILLAAAENFLLTGEPVDEAGNDGILTAYEAMNLSLDNTDVVVLSACETGLGVVKNGEGVYGLQRAFGIAGAHHIIMSLWNVDDDATQELMSLLYLERQNTPNLYEAFRKAQQKLKEKYPEPFYWGAFVLVGL